jgi:hypothetical protein
MSGEPFFKRIKTCEAKYGNNETVRYVIFATTNGLFVGVVVYVHRQLKNGDQDNTIDVKHFPDDTEQKAIDGCESWIKENINDHFSVNCIES